MIFEWLEKIIFMSTGYIFGLALGLSIGISGVYTITSSRVLMFILYLGGFIGMISLIVLMRNDSKIEGIRK